MAIADKIIALLDTMTVASLDSLSPVRRRQFGDLCHHWANIAERPKGQLARPRTLVSGRDAAAVLAGSPHGGAIASASAKPPGGEI